jgi:tRNA (guanine-N7-)-methyltransferase
VNWNFSGVVVPSGGRVSRVSGESVSIEIGFGNGEFLARLARAKPNSLAVGMEVSQWCVAKAARRALAGGLENVRLMCGDARYLLRYAFDPGAASDIYMNFPCPWPKRRHAGRRVSGAAFAATIASRLAEGGAFVLATDVEQYAEETREAFAASGAFVPGAVERNPEREFQTKYERKWRKMGRDIYEFRAVKASDADENQAGEEITEEEITGAEISSEDFRARVSALAGSEAGRPGYKIIFRDVYFSGEAALAATITVDEGFEQHFYIKITRRRGRLAAATDFAGRPYRTPAVRAALKLAAGI